jgi:hypothetical protein
MEQVARTTTRPAKDGRLTLEVEFDGGNVYFFEVEAERFYKSLAEILREGIKVGEWALPELPKSSFAPKIASPS